MTDQETYEPLDEVYKQFLVVRRAQILNLCEDALRSSGRSLDEVCVQAVSKTVDSARMLAAYEAGWNCFAENRPQELVRKRAALTEAGLTGTARLDMIGNLQTNKINQVLGNAELIHSISSEHLAQAVSKRAEAKNLCAQVLLEVNVSGEESKSGFSVLELRECFEALLELEGIQIQGLMCMAPAHDDVAARSSFSGLRELRDELEVSFGVELPELSCGMSDDFEIALEEGSTIVRLGRVVFDANYDLE